MVKCPKILPVVAKKENESRSVLLARILSIHNTYRVHGYSMLPGNLAALSDANCSSSMGRNWDELLTPTLRIHQAIMGVGD